MIRSAEWKALNAKENPYSKRNFLALLEFLDGH
jgi:hypothetical protein